MFRCYLGLILSTPKAGTFVLAGWLAKSPNNSFEIDTFDVYLILDLVELGKSGTGEMGEVGWVDGWEEKHTELVTLTDRL